MIRALMVTVPILLQGCTALTPPLQRPLLEDHMRDPSSNNQIGILATTSDRRVVLINTTTQKFCAEPSPDVVQSLTESLRAVANANASAQINDVANNTKQGSAALNAEIARQLATTSSALFNRSQGVQLFRDASYALCQAYLNGAVQGDDGTTVHFESARTSLASLKDELSSRSPSVTNLELYARMANVSIEKQIGVITSSGKTPSKNLTNLQSNVSALARSDFGQIVADKSKLQETLETVKGASNLADSIKSDKSDSAQLTTTRSEGAARSNYSDLFVQLLAKVTDIIKAEIPTTDTKISISAKESAEAAQSKAEVARAQAQVFSDAARQSMESSSQSATAAASSASAAQAAAGQALGANGAASKK